MTVTCPTRATLSQFSAGRLSAGDIEQVAEHLESCTACQSALETLADQDDLVRALAVLDEPEQFAQEAACVCFVQHLATESRTDCETRLSMSRAHGSGLPDTLPGDRRSEAEAAVLPAGVRFGQYVLLRQIGRGGMGAVYQALHTHLERVVAVKMLGSDRMQDADAVARFEREMRAVGRLEHPQIVRAMDAGKHDDVSYLVMEYVHGPDVSAVVNGFGPLRIPDACEIARQAALGLEYAFRRGLVHRDIKPSNLMIDVGEDCVASASGWASAHRESSAQSAPHELGGLTPSRSPDPARVRVLDFGLALLEDSRGVAVAGLTSPNNDAELTSAGQLMGTLDYIAPEQVGSSHDVDVRADIYSLGATLFKLLTGYAPFATDQVVNPAKRMHEIRNSDARPVSALRSEVPAELVAIVARMLARDPSTRYQTPNDVAAALAPFAAGADLKRLALEVWNPETTLVTMRELPSILAKQRALQDATLPHLLPNVERAPREPTTDRLGHDETGTNLATDLERGSGRRTRESSRASETSRLEASSDRSLTSLATPATALKRAARWGVSITVFVALAAFGISKWWTPITSDDSPTTHTAPVRQPAVPIITPFDELAAIASQTAWAEELSVPVEFENSIGMRFRVIPPGKFTMGMTPEEFAAVDGAYREGFLGDLLASSSTQREVTLTKPFAIGVTEVTVEQFARFVDATGHESKNDGQTSRAWSSRLLSKDVARLPVTAINWHDAVAFADWLGRKEKATYSLPTEAEWEFVCRAGRLQPWPETREDIRHDNSGDNLTLDDVAWFGMSGKLSQPVGQKRPNAFGLHDLLGNAAEWCHDNCVMTLDAEPATDPQGPPFGDQRSVRGGSVEDDAVGVRPGFRFFARPISLSHNWGFRLVRRFDDTAESRRQWLRPVRELDEQPTPFGENSVEVGIGAQISVPTLRPDVTRPMTLELFVTPRWSEFRETRHVAGTSGQFSLFVTPNERGSSWSLGIERTDRFQGLITATPLEPGRRVHLAAVRDGQVVRVFVDGKLAMQQDERPTAIKNDAPKLAFGGMTGTMDEVRFSNSARYTSEFIPQPRFEPDEHTVALWHFDEGHGLTAFDASGNGHHAKLQGARWTRETPSEQNDPVPVVVQAAAPAPRPAHSKLDFQIQPPQANTDNALWFRDNNRVIVPSLKLSAISQLTLEMFATPTDEPSAAADWQVLGGFAYQSRWLLNPQGSLAFANETPHKGQTYAWGPTPDCGRRLHLAGVIDGQSLRLFVNGRKLMDRTLRRLELAQPGSPFTLGAHNDGSYPFHGVIDEVRLSNVARYVDPFEPESRFEPDEHTLALYHCDEIDGDRLLDASGHEHHGRIIGAARLRANSLALVSPLTTDVVFLDDLQELDFDGHPDFGKHGLDHAGEQIEWRSRRPRHAVMLHPHANGAGRVDYELGGKFTTFEGTAAINDSIESVYRPLVPLRFRVLGDGRVLWTSRPLRDRGDGEEFRVSVRGVQQLRLETVCPGDNTGAHTFWLEPRLRTESAADPVQLRLDANTTVAPAQPEANNALLFREGNSVLVDALSLDPASELTIELFATPTDDRSGDWRFLAGWVLQARLQNMPNGRLAFGLDTANGGVIYAEGQATRRSERHHLAGVFDGTTARLFVNGVKRSEQLVPKSALKDHRVPFTIGARRDGKSQFLGLIDEVRVSNVARYRDDFTPAMRFEPDEHTLALFHCDECDGELLLDASGHERHGQIHKATRVLVDSLRINAAPAEPISQSLPAGLQFDGVNDSVEIPTLKVDGSTPYTLEAWLWHEHQRTQQFPVAIWGDRAGLQLQTNNGHSILDGVGPQQSEMTVAFLKPAWPVRKRLHVAMGWQPGEVQVFINGEPQAVSVIGYPRDNALPSEGTRIGARSFQNNKMINFFAGRIDELRLSRRFRYHQAFKPLEQFDPDDDTLALYKFDEGQGTELRDWSGHNHHGRIIGATWVPASIGDSDATAPKILNPNDGWVEIGSKVQLPDDIAAGSWRRNGTVLESLGDTAPGSPPRLPLPLIPQGGYEVQFTFTRLTGDGAIAIHIPVGRSECVVGFDQAWPGHSDRVAGLQFLNGRRVFHDDNPTRVVSNLENNTEYRVTIRVELNDDESAHIQVTLDDEKLVDWTGPQTSLGADPRWGRDPLGIGTSENATANFYNLSVRILSDTARLRR